MQIFCPSIDPAQSAAWLDDARVKKMVVETAQLLSAAFRQLRGDDLRDFDAYEVPPSGRELWMWAVKHDGNWDWLACHGKALIDELDLRGLSPGKFLRPRAILHDFYQPWAKQFAFVGHSGLKRHQQASGFVNRAVNQAKAMDFRHVSDVHDAYRQYLAARWRLEAGKARWTFRDPPEWFGRAE